MVLRFAGLKPYGIAASAAFVLMCLMSVFISQPTFAGREVNSRLSYGNAGSYCSDPYTGERYSARGMVWISNDPTDYYSEKVIVGPNDKEVSVQVRGALNTCTTSIRDSNNTQVWAAGVTSFTSRLVIHGSEFYRGNVSRYTQYEWSYGHEAKPYSHLDATLDVSSLAVCTNDDAGKTKGGAVGVAIYRYLQWRQEVNGRWNIENALDGIEGVTIPLTRNCPYDFQLDPSLTVSPNFAETGADVSFSPSVNNTGSTISTSAKWELTRFTVPPSGTIPNAGQDDRGPTAYYGNGATKVSSGEDVVFAKGVTAVGAGSQTVDDYPVGTRLCYALSVQPYKHNDSKWNHSTPACTTIAKSPKVQVQAGDLIVGRGTPTNPGRTSNIVTSTTNKGGTYFGSWAEYGIIPTGCVSGMASGSGYVGGASTSNLTADLSLLTFTRPPTGITCPSGIGGYRQSTIAPNVAGRFPINVKAEDATPSKPADPQVLPSTSFNIGGGSLRGTYQAPAGQTALTITGGDPIPAASSLVINAPRATVTITGDIRYTTGALRNLGDVPQVIIIAKNIIIADNVRQIDAWLVATGSGADGIINTCGAGGVSQTSPLTYQQCDQLLTVNGPVMANHLVLRRTGGSGTGVDSGAPAEVFNLRADAFIWGTNYNLGSGRLSTVSTKELPPRF